MIGPCPQATSELQAEPAFGFTVVGLIIVFGPLIAERLRLPGLLGLLVLGAVVEPNVLDLFPTFATLRSIGAIGVLYLIFLSGLQLELDSFAKHWRISAGFGGLTSFFPLVLGTLAALVAGIDLVRSILIGSFWASFTLIAYPVITRYGITKKPAVARWFFSGLGQERTLRFMLVLVGMTSAALVAEAVGVAALIGAFFVGVGLNRLVPNASPLMAVTEFYGNAFFIPAFLVSVGLLFDPQLMFQGSTIRLALGFAAALILGKSIAAIITAASFGSSEQRSA